MSKRQSGLTGPTAIQRLADWAASIRAGDVPAHAIAQAQLLLLDTLGCGLAALNEHSACTVLEANAELGGTPACSVIGSAARTSLPNAVFANGTLIRVLDLNDYVIEADGSLGGHPSDNIPVALAAGEFADRSGREVLASIVLGYELYGRCKNMMDRRGAWDGSSLSGIVAPVMAGWLMHLDRTTLAHAVALSVARAATSAVVRSGDISAAKSLANALVAQSGVQSALLARHGITGPLQVFDHPRGMKTVFPHFDAGVLTAALPADGYIMKSNAKAYPCVATAQAAVAAAIELHPAAGDTGQIERIAVTMADVPSARTHIADEERADPKSRESADHSFHFAIAAALADGAFGLKQFDNERWNDPALRRLMGLMMFSTDAGLAQRAPGSYPCAIEVQTMDGKQHRAEVLFPPGFSNNGLEQATIVAKFEDLTPHLTPAAREGIIDAVMALDKSPSLTTLQAALAGAA
jgi:2-methylcitrate dehydratase